MPDLGARVHELRVMEGLSANDTAIHRLHPAAKLLYTFVFIIVVASFGRYSFTRLVPFLFYPFVMMGLAETPYKVLLSRVLIAMPFCLFAGISNAVFDTETAFTIMGVAVSFGVLSLATIFIKMYLCVMAALLLVATTAFTELTAQLRRIRVPIIFVMVFEMTFRYIGVLVEEVFSMTTAYQLRSGSKRALDIRHMGSFAGQVLLRGFDRAECIHAAMSCRGYSLEYIRPAPRSFRVSDAMALAAVCLPSLLMRVLAVLVTIQYR